jgi:hypothetical protein
MWKGVLVVMVMIIRWKFGGSTMQKNFLVNLVPSGTSAASQAGRGGGARDSAAV